MLAADFQGINFVKWAIIIGVGGTLFMIGLSFAAFVLKTACRLVGVEVPDTGKAMVVSFLESLACGTAYMTAMILVGYLGKAMQADKAMIGAIAGLALLTLAIGVPAGLYVPMLRVTFPKGVALSFLRYSITFSIFLALGLGIAMVAPSKYRSKLQRSAASRDNLPASLQIVPHDVAVEFAAGHEKHPALR